MSLVNKDEFAALMAGAEDRVRQAIVEVASASQEERDAVEYGEGGWVQLIYSLAHYLEKFQELRWSVDAAFLYSDTRWGKKYTVVCHDDVYDVNMGKPDGSEVPSVSKIMNVKYPLNAYGRAEEWAEFLSRGRY